MRLARLRSRARLPPPASPSSSALPCPPLSIEIEGRLGWRSARCQEAFPRSGNAGYFFFCFGRLAVSTKSRCDRLCGLAHEIAEDRDALVWYPHGRTAERDAAHLLAMLAEHHP